MYYIVQENLFREEGFHQLMEIFERHYIEHEVVKFIPFVHEIDFKTTRKDVFVFGSVNMSHTCKKYDFVPGSMYNENHDVEVYGKYYGDEMLNSDGHVMRFGDPLPFDNFLFFARPTKDTKAFTGQVFTQEAWKEYVQECIKNDALKNLNEETKVLIASLKHPQQEVRCWIVNGKVITISRYKLGNFVNTQNYDHEQGFIDYAQKIADIYCPAEAFVLDICLVDDQYKIVEINCFNCAGFYDGNMFKIIEALENHFNK
jgi:ATP-grasp domain, R2K clade family 3